MSDSYMHYESEMRAYNGSASKMWSHSIWTNTSVYPATTQNHTIHLCSANFSHMVGVGYRSHWPSLTVFVHTVDIPPSQVNILDGNKKDLIGECVRPRLCVSLT